MNFYKAQNYQDWTFKNIRNNERKKYEKRLRHVGIIGIKRQRIIKISNLD